MIVNNKYMISKKSCSTPQRSNENYKNTKPQEAQKENQPNNRGIDKKIDAILKARVLITKEPSEGQQKPGGLGKSNLSRTIDCHDRSAHSRSHNRAYYRC